MRKLAYLGVVVVCVLALGTPPASAHNAGCVQTGNGKWVFVGSNKEAPLVSAHNPHFLPTADPNDPADTGQLDLQPGSGDQYGARFAADQGNSAVERPSSLCSR